MPRTANNLPLDLVRVRPDASADFSMMPAPASLDTAAPADLPHEFQQVPGPSSMFATDVQMPLSQPAQFPRPATTGQTLPDDLVRLPTAESRGWVQQNISDPFMRGLEQTQSINTLGGLMSGGVETDEAVGSVVRNSVEAQQYPVQPDTQQFREALGEDSILGALGRVATTPSVWGELILEQGGNILTGLAGSAAGGALGSVGGLVGRQVGGALGGGGTALFQEVGGAVLEQLSEENIPPTQEGLEAAFNDPAFMERAREKGIARGVPIAIFATLSGAVAGRLAGAVASRAGGGLGARLAGLGAETGAQFTWDGAGEIAAQLNDEGAITQPSEVALEAILGVPGAISEIPNVIFNQPAPPADAGAGALPQTPPPLPQTPQTPPPLPQQGQATSAPVPAQTTQAPPLPTEGAVPPPLPTDGTAQPTVPSVGAADPAQVPPVQSGAGQRPYVGPDSPSAPAGDASPVQPQQSAEPEGVRPASPPAQTEEAPAASVPPEQVAPPEFDPLPVKSRTPRQIADQLTRDDSVIAEDRPDGRRWVGSGQGMIRSDVSPQAQRLIEERGAGRRRTLPEGAVDRVVSYVERDVKGNGTQPVTWLGEANMRGEQMRVGTLPDGTRVAIKSHLADLLGMAGAGTSIVSVNSSDGKKAAEQPVVALNSDGDVVAVTMPMRVGDGLDARSPAGRFDSAENARKRITELEKQVGPVESRIRRDERKTDPKVAKRVEADKRKRDRLREEIDDLGAIAEPKPEPKATRNFVQPASRDQSVLADGDGTGSSRLPDASTEQVSSPSRTPPPLPQSEDGDGDASAAPMEDKRRPTRKGANPPSVRAEPSRKRNVWQELGEDPDSSELLPAGEQNKRLSGAVKAKYGFKAVGAPKDAKANQVNDQLKEAHTNLQWMAHVLGLPIKAMSLAGRLSLSMARQTPGAFGIYDPNTKTIGLFGRSNSFAHEWFHAMDHWLIDKLENLKPQQLEGLASRAVRGGKLMDDHKSLTPIEERFVNLLNVLFFDQAKLAATVLKAEASHANKARQKEARLKTGASQSRSMDSTLRARIKNAVPANKQSYFNSAPEILARVFEAYLAHKIALTGGDDQVVTKGDAAYRGEGDLLLIDIYPSLAERHEIFMAIDKLFEAMRAERLFGSAAAAARPDDTVQVSPTFWAETVRDAKPDADENTIREDVEALKALGRRVANSSRTEVLAGLKQSLLNSAGHGAIRSVYDPLLSPENQANRGYARSAKNLLYSIRGRLEMLERLEGAAGKAFGLARDRVATRPGEGKDTGVTFSERYERMVAQYAAKLDDAIKSNGLRRVLTVQRGGVAQERGKKLRQLLLGKDVPDATPGLRKLASTMRSVMTDLHAKLEALGIDIGYVSETGYLPRQWLYDVVDRAQDKFLTQAAKVYDLVFERREWDAKSLKSEARRLTDPADKLRYSKDVDDALSALKQAERDEKQGKATEEDVDQAVEDLREALAEPWAKAQAHDWKTAMLLGDMADSTARGPDGNPLKKRVLPPETDEIMAEFMNTDPVDLYMRYTMTMARQIAYVERFGKIGGETDVAKIMRRPENAKHRASPRYDQGTNDGRVNIIRDLTDVSRDDVLGLVRGAAIEAGASQSGLDQFDHDMLQLVGRAGGKVSEDASMLSNTIFSLGLLLLLPRMIWTMASEPATIILRGGSVTGAGKASLVEYAKGLSSFVRQAESTKELAAMAKVIGVMATPLYEFNAQNQFNADFDKKTMWDEVIARFFRVNLATPVTNIQRMTAIRGGMIVMQEMAAQVRGSKPKDAKRARFELLELGISDARMDEFIDWAGGMELGQLPDIALVAEPGTLESMWGDAMARFIDTTIMNPRREDKVYWAASPYGRIVTSLTSFIYKFTQEIHLAALAATRRDADLLGVGKRDILKNNKMEYAKALGPHALNFSLGFSFLFAGQLLTTIAREWLFSPERWDEKGDEDERAQWLMNLALSRTGVAGVLDIPWNLMTGLRYERDLTSLTAGAAGGYMAGNIQNILRGLSLTGRNSPNNTNAEHSAVKALYRLTAVPAASILLSNMPGASWPAMLVKLTALQMLTSPGAATLAADTVYGERD